MKGSIGMVILIKQIQKDCPLYFQLPILIHTAAQSYWDIRSLFLLTPPPAFEGDWTFFNASCVLVMVTQVFLLSSWLCFFCFLFYFLSPPPPRPIVHWLLSFGPTHLDPSTRIFFFDLPPQALPIIFKFHFQKSLKSWLFLWPLLLFNPLPSHFFLY